MTDSGDDSTWKASPWEPKSDTEYPGEYFHEMGDVSTLAVGDPVEAWYGEKKRKKANSNPVAYTYYFFSGKATEISDDRAIITVRWDDDGKVQQVPAKYVRVFNMKSLPVLVVGDSVVARYNVCGKWFVATVEAVNGNYCNLKYRDGETEADVRRDLVTHYSVYANQRSAIVKALLKSGKLLLAPCTVTSVGSAMVEEFAAGVEEGSSGNAESSKKVKLYIEDTPDHEHFNVVMAVYEQVISAVTPLIKPEALMKDWSEKKYNGADIARKILGVVSRNPLYKNKISAAPPESSAKAAKGATNGTTVKSRWGNTSAPVILAELLSLQTKLRTTKAAAEGEQENVLVEEPRTMHCMFKLINLICSNDLNMWQEFTTRKKAPTSKELTGNAIGCNAPFFGKLAEVYNRDYSECHVDSAFVTNLGNARVIELCDVDISKANKHTQPQVYKFVTDLLKDYKDIWEKFDVSGHHDTDRPDGQPFENFTTRADLVYWHYMLKIGKNLDIRGQTFLFAQLPENARADTGGDSAAAFRNMATPSRIDSVAKKRKLMRCNSSSSDGDTADIAKALKDITNRLSSQATKDDIMKKRSMRIQLEKHLIYLKGQLREIRKHLRECTDIEVQIDELQPDAELMEAQILQAQSELDELNEEMHVVVRMHI